MKTISKSAYFPAMTIILLLCSTSCVKHDVTPGTTNVAAAIKGCTNKEAANYNSNATQDDGSCCVPKVDLYQRSLNVFLLGVPLPFATFKFAQTDKTYSGGCSQNSYSTVLKIQNLTGRNLTFSYTINFALNLLQWSSSNTVTILPGQTLDVGEVSQNPGRVDVGLIGISCYGIIIS